MEHLPYNDDDIHDKIVQKHPIDKVTGGGERPLAEKLPDNIEVKAPWSRTLTLSGAFELHRQALEGKLKGRETELTEDIINAKCSYQDGFHTEVMQDGRVAFFPNSTQVTPLFLACEFKVWKSALLLLNAGADPNKARKNGTEGNQSSQYC